VTGPLFLALAILVVVAGVAARRRTRSAKRSGMTDDLVRQIETLGRIDAEEIHELDVDEARQEEDRFWAQTWDEPEEL